MNANVKAKAIYPILYIYVLLVEWKDRERLVLWVNGAYYQRNNSWVPYFFILLVNTLDRVLPISVKIMY